MIRLALVVFVMAASSPALSAEFDIKDHVVTQITTGWGAEGIYTITEGPLPAGANCGSGNNFVMEPSHPMKSEMLALLISALHSNAKVGFYVDGCIGGSMKVRAVSAGR